MAADYNLTLEVGYNPQQLDSVCNKIENELSEIEANVKIVPETKALAGQTKKNIKNIVNDALDELSKLDPSQITNETVEKTFSKYVKAAEKNIKEIAASIRGSLGDNSELASSIENIFKEVESSASGYSKVVQEVVAKSKDLGSVVSIASNLKKEYQQMIKELEELKELSSASKMQENVAAFVGSLDTVEKAETAYSELGKQYKKLQKEFLTVNELNANAKSTEERLAFEKRLIEVERERLLVAMQIEAVQKEFNFKAFKFGSQNILNELTAVSEGQNYFDQAIDKTTNSLKELAYGISTVLSKELDLAGIMNAGAINIAARLEITTTKEEMVAKIKERLLEVQQAIYDEQNLIVPIKYVITTNEQDTLSNTEKKNLRKNMEKNAQSMIGEVVVDAGTIFADIEKRGTDAANSLANQAIQEIQGVFDNNKIEVKFDNVKAIEELEEALKAAKMGDSIDISNTLSEANDSAKKLLNYFKDITGELESQNKLITGETEIQPSKFNTENIVQMTSQALQKAQEAVDELDEYFVQHPVTMQFNMKASLTNLKGEISKQEYSEQFDITPALKKAVEYSTKLSLNLENISNLDFKSKSISEIDFATMLSQIESIAANLEGIVAKIQIIQEANFKESIHIDLGESLKEITNLSNAVILLAGEIQDVGKASNVSSLNESLDSILSKVSRIKKAINGINVKSDVIKSFENLQEAISVLSNSKLNNFETFATTVRQLSDIDGKGLGAMFKSFRNVRDNDIDNIYLLGEALKDLKKELDELDKTSSGFLSQLESILHSSEALKALATIVQKTGTNLEKAKQSVSNVSKDITKDVDKIKASIEGLDRPANKNDYLGDYTGKLENLQKAIDEFDDEVERINKMPEHLVFQSDIQRIKDMKTNIIELNYQLDESEKKAKSPAKENAIKKLNKFLKDSSKLTQEEREQIDALITRINNPNLSIREFKEIMTTFNEISSNAIRAGRATSSFFDAIRNKLKYGWAQSIAQFFSFYDVIRYVREISQTVTELNSSLIELAKVSEASIGELYDDFQDFASIAKETGGTVNDIIKATSDWARNGYNLPDSKELARISSIFQNIGDNITQEQANEYLVSTLKGFRLEAEESIHIIDVINNVSNNAASGVSDIGEALERSSSALGAANTSMEKSVALLTTANEILQNPETVGTAFKSMSARLRAADTEIESLEDGFTLTTSKLRDLVQALTGFDIQATEDSYKDIYDILLGISEQWSQLTDIEQASLSEELFGKRNSQVGFAILQNGERLQEIYQLALNSQGSAMEEQAKYMEGAQYQIDRFRASVETLANDTMSSDFLKGAIAGARTFIDVLDVLIDRLGALPILLGTIGSIASAKGFGITGSKLEEDFNYLFSKQKSTFESPITIISENDKASLKQFNQLLDDGVSYSDAFNASMTTASLSAQEFAQSFDGIAKGSRNVYQEYEELIAANNELNIAQLASTHSLSNASQLISHYNQNVAGSATATQAFATTVNTGNHSLAAYITSLNGAQGSLAGYIKFAGMAAAKTIAFKAAAMAMQMVLVMLVSYLVGKAIQAINDYIHKNEKLIEVANEAKQAIDEMTKSLNNQKKTIQESARRFAELSQGIDQLTGKNISLSDEDYQEFLDISNELVEVFPTLSHHYDENGNAIVDLNGDVSTIVDSLENLLKIEEKLAREKILEKIPDLYKGALAQVDEDGLNQEIAQLQTAIESFQSLVQAKKDEFQWSGILSDEDVELIDKYERKLIELGIEYDRLNDNTIQVAPELLGGDTLDNIFSVYEEKYNQYANDLENKIREKNKQIANEMTSNIAAELADDSKYQGMSDELKVVTQQIIQNLDWNALEEEFGDNWEQTWAEIKKTVINPIAADDNTKIQLKFAFEAQTLFNNGQITVAEYQKRLKDILPLLEGLDDETQKSIKLILGIQEDGDTVIAAANNVQKQIEQTLNGKDISFKIEDLIGGLKKDTLDKLQETRINWNKVINPDNLQSSIDAIEAEIRRISDTPFKIKFEKANIEKATDGVKELQSTYQSLYDKMAEGKEGTDLAFLMTDIESLEEKLTDADGQLQVSEDTWKEFFDVMTDGSHSFEEMETALNKVLTEYVNNTVQLENFDKAQADAISTQLQLAGVTKESADAYTQSMTEAANAIQDANDKSFDFVNATYEEIDSMFNLGEQSDTTAQLILAYSLKKKLANGYTIKTAADVDNLLTLANAAGIAIKGLQRYEEIKADLDAAIASGDTQLIRNVRLTMDTYIKELDAAKLAAEVKVTAGVDKLEQDREKAAAKSKKSSGSKEKEEDKWKEAYEKELADLNHLHEMELISDIQYYEERERLNDKYFKDNEKYTEDYNKNLEEIYKGFQSAYKQYVDEMSDYWKKALDANKISFKEYCDSMLSMLNKLHDAGKIDDETYYSKLADYYGSVIENYDKVISAVQRRLKKQIDDLNKQKDAIKSNYETRIQSIQDEIDALNKANDARKKELDLQKALYELNRAENQRTQYRYESDKGFVYRAFEKDIKTAQKDIEQLRFEKHISLLEKKIESLRDEMDSLNDDIDSQIDKLQEYSNKWGEVANKYKERQEDIIAAAVLGSNWQNEILAANYNTLNTFTSEYMNLQGQQAQAAYNATVDIVKSYQDRVNALNEWKRAQEEAAKTSFNASVSSKPSSPGGSPTNTSGQSAFQQVIANNKANTYSRQSNTTYKPTDANRKANRTNAIKQYTFGSGTKSAPYGIHEVAENGDEIIRDNYGNAYLVKGHQLHYFEGGERVYNPSETKELLKGQYEAIDSLLPNYQDMLNKVTNATIAPLANMNSNILKQRSNVKTNSNGKSVVVTIGDIHITEVDNANQLARVIKNNLPNALLQELNKH